MKPEPATRAALEAARDEMPRAALLAAHVPGDAVWPRVLDKEDAIEAARHGLVAVRAIEPAAVLVRDDLPARSFLEVARALTETRGYLVPHARAVRTGPSPHAPRVRALLAPFWSPEERLWQVFMAARRRGGHGAPSAASHPR